MSATLRRSPLCMVLAAACWGFATVMSKGVLAYIPPLTLLVVQLTASIASLWIVIFAGRVRIHLDRRFLWPALFGLLEPGLDHTLSLIGLTWTTASMSTLIWDIEPIIIIGLALVILREHLTWPLLIFSVVAISGVVLVAGVNTNVQGNTVLIGNLLVLAGVFCCSLYTVLTRRVVSTLETLPLVALQQTVAWVWALVIWPTELLHGAIPNLSSISAIGWGWAALSGVLYYAAAYLFYISGLKKTPASFAGFYFNLIPIFGVTGAYLFLGERLIAAQWLGAVLILFSVGSMFWLQRGETTLVTAYT